MSAEFIAEFRPNINELKIQLIKQAKNECQTYAEVNQFLKVRKKHTIWCNDLILTELIREVEEFFEKEKGSLPLK